MNPYKHLESQHDEIKELLNTLKEGANVKAAQEQTDDLVKVINTLAGKLRIHMGTEDRHLYPELAKSKESQVKHLSTRFNTEMTGLFEAFTAYKNQFNTRSKILNDSEGFVKASQAIESKLIGRIKEEDLHLYPALRKETSHENF